MWRFRRHWPHEQAQRRADLLAGPSQIGLLARVPVHNGDEGDLWSARDAVVMQALALVVPQPLPRSPRYTHRTGHGGLHYAVWEVVKALP